MMKLRGRLRYDFDHFVRNLSKVADHILTVG